MGPHIDLGQQATRRLAVLALLGPALAAGGAVWLLRGRSRWGSRR